MTVAFVPPPALFGLAQDMIMKGWQPVWCLARQSGAFTPIPGTTGGSSPFPAIEPQPEVLHKLAFRPPHDVIIFDVDHYDDKCGQDTMDRAEAWLGDLPPTWRVTARGGINPSGRYLFRKPADLDFTDSALSQFADEEGHTSVEVVRTSHRFSWAPGDIHYKNNEYIQCFDPYGDLCDLPEVSELPELPERWITYLRNPPVAQHAEVYTRPSDGPEWWLAQADASLGTRAELAQFAFDLLASRLTPDQALMQIRRVALALDDGRPWADEDFYGLVDGNTERKVSEILAKQDGETALAAEIAGGYDKLGEISARQAARYEDKQELIGRIEPQVTYDDDVYQEAMRNLPAPPEDAEPSIEDRLRNLDGYQPLLFTELARTQAKKDAAKILSAQFTGYKNISRLPKPPKPAMLVVTGKDVPGTVIIPPRTVTVLSGHKGGGKSWTAVTWAAQEIRAGNHVLWVDFERQAEGLNERFELLNVGAHLVENQVHYADGALPPVERMVSDVRTWSDKGSRRVLVIVDAFRGLQATVAPGTSANDGDAVEAVYLEVLNPLVEAGATIAVIDHLPKAATGPTASTFGSERKESAADYVITVEQLPENGFSRKKSGYSTLTITKDRYGHHERGEVAGYLWVPGDDGKRGPSFRDWPSTPDIRNWSPAEEAELADFEMSEKSRRLVAVTAVVGDNRLRFGPRPLAREVTDQYPELFPLKEDVPAADQYKAALSFINRMKNDGQLVQDGATKTLDLPQAPGRKPGITPEMLRPPEDEVD